MIPTAMTSDPTQPWIAIYDADCGFCRWSLAKLLGLDRHRRLRPVALGTAEAEELLADLTPVQRAASWHLVSPAGERASAGIAAVPLLRVIGAGPLADLLARFPRATEWTYGWVADHRSYFSKAIPDRAKERADARIARSQR